MAKQSWAERAREKSQKAAEKAASRTGGNELEWTPDFGSHKVRIFPPINLTFDVIEKDGAVIPSGEEDMFFYMTHSYHFMDGIGNEGKGKLLWTPKKFDAKSGEGLFYHGHTCKIKSDPIDEVVRQLYSTGRAENDQSILATAGKIKRKRQFFVNVILLDEKDPEKRYRILVDKTNEGKLIRKICEHMGFPFYRDVEDEWVVKESLERDPDREYYDLIDPKEGFDFKIVKEKTGSNPWDMSYEKSMPITKQSRALTEEEETCLDKRVDLRTYAKYSNLAVVEAALNEYFGEEVKTEVTTPASSEEETKAKVQAKEAKSIVTSVEDIDGLLDELEDE